MINYREELSVSKAYKEKYADGFEEIIKRRERELSEKRRAYAKDIFKTPEKYREDFKRMLGWPLVDHEDGELPVRSTKLSREEGYTIYRMELEILEGLVMTGLYFELDGEEKKPLVIVQHGGLGTPEHIAGIDDTDTSNYNRMLERVLAQGVHVFAPQLFLWDEKKYEVAGDRREFDARLKRLGGSVTAVELYGLKRILDYFEKKDNVLDYGMVGLSYGGFYTLFLSAIETRIRSAISCSFFNSRDNYPWSDWCWLGSAERFDDVEIACLSYPRSLCIEIGMRDELFNGEWGVKSYEALAEACGEVGTDWLTFIPFDGTHEFCKDDEPIRRLANELKNIAK